MIQEGEKIRRVVSGWKIFQDQDTGRVFKQPVFSEEFIGAYKQVIANTDRYQAALEKIAPTEARINALREKYADEQVVRIQQQIAAEERLGEAERKYAYLRSPAATVQQALIQNPDAVIPSGRGLGTTNVQFENYGSVIKNLEAQLASLEAQTKTFVSNRLLSSIAPRGLTDLKQQFAGFQEVKALEAALTSRQATLSNPVGLNAKQIQHLEAEATALKKILTAIPQSIDEGKALITAALNEYRQALDAETAGVAAEIERLELEFKKLQGVNAQAAGQLERQIAALRASNPGYRQLEEAANATPPISSNLRDTLTKSDSLRKQLLKAGLGAGAKFDLSDDSGFAQALAKQEAVVTKFERNLRTGVTSIRGQWRQLGKDLQGNEILGAMETFSADIDKNGKVITRWGGQLSGAGSILQQTVRDFQKVIEWTVATTLVFGSLGAAIKGLDLIKELDANLTRFSVTANLSAQETKQFYSQIVNVAQLTATPLDELVKSADDLALAVRRPGESAQELTKDVLTLSTAVGVFTNLTGTDTVQATDQLVAVMKQLGISTTETFGILTKITAVAGGQSAAINDITKGLSVMAEAGKAANLTVDQQIATIKVLSQVTSKTPAEVATAFKNLAGALENPAAIKALQSYNIGLISQGNSIIDIYTQIAQKIRQGIIPQNNVSGLLRAISGGPRRAPDAAALLGNIDSVLNETTVSANATNEAFIANAKVLDTLNAKFVQFQNTLKDRTFRQFGEVFKSIATAGISALTGLLNIIGLIPSGMITVGLQAAGLLIAFKGLTSVLEKLGLTFLLTGKAQQQFTQLTFEDAIAQKEAAAAISLRQKAMTTLSKAPGALTGGTARAIGASALLGGALSLASGGDLRQNIGTALQSGGLAALTLAPIPWVKIAGGVAFLAGSLLSMSDSANKAADSEKEVAASTLDAYTAFKNSSTTLAELQSRQKDITAEMNQTGISVEALGELQRQFVDNSIAMTQAQTDLNTALAGLHEVNPEFATLVKNVQDGLRPATALTEQLRLLQKTVLQTNFPNIALPTENARSAFTGTAPVRPETGPAPNAILPANGFVPQRVFDLTKLKDDANEVKKLFTDDGTAITATFAATSENIEAVRAALASIDDTKFREAGLKALDGWVATRNAVESAISAVNLYEAELSASQPFFTPEDFTSVQDGLKILKELILLKNANKISDEDFNRLSKKYGDIISDALASGKGINTSVFQEAAKDIAGYIDPALKDAQQGTIAWANSLNEVAYKILGIPNLFGKVRGAQAQLSEETSKLAASIDDTLGKVLGGFSDESFKLHLQLTGGEDVQDQIDRLGKLRTFITDLRAEVSKGFDIGGDSFGPVLEDLASRFSDIPGLEDAASIGAEGFINKLVDMAQNGKLSADQIGSLNSLLADFFRNAQTLADIRSNPTLGISGTNKDAILKELQAKKAGLDQAILSSGGNVELNLQLNGVNDAITALQGVTDPIELIKKLLLQAGDASGEATKKIHDDFGNLREQLQSDLASKSANLFQQFLNGDITAKEYRKAAAGLNVMRNAVNGVTGAFENAAATGGADFEESLHAVAKALVGIPGLEDATSLSATQLAERMINNADAFGITGKAAQKLKQDVINLTNTAIALSRIKAQFNLKANIDVHGAILALKALLASYRTTFTVLGRGGLSQEGGVAPLSSPIIQQINAAIAELSAYERAAKAAAADIQYQYSHGSGTSAGSVPKTSSGGTSTRTGGTSTKPDISEIDVPDEIANAYNRDDLIKLAIAKARSLQSKIPGAVKDAKNDIVELLKGTQRILEVRGIKDDYLRRALEELADIEKKRLDFESKADTIRRIRVGAGSFAALANVPLNNQTGVSVGGSEGPVTVNLNINGQVLTPAQFAQLADQIAAAIKRQIANG